MKFTLLTILSGLLILRSANCIPYIVEGDSGLADYGNRFDDNLIEFDKRSCIHRGGSCDDRRNDCCFNSACRCNLWGTNCRCQRAGLFQRWGRK
ncbi:U8-agatoxin-Ao1a-like [Uloborus diversus]|uniref:U8-agatoxin-Ao1a-like n=1 Tax=Uloborus diversus TaxID=327109 RepID=UPI00240900C7|nr:U8-agatoxin-Ao1a-like [Uloborus diversus]